MHKNTKVLKASGYTLIAIAAAIAGLRIAVGEWQPTACIILAVIGTVAVYTGFVADKDDNHTFNRELLIEGWEEDDDGERTSD